MQITAMHDTTYVRSKYLVVFERPPALLRCALYLELGW